jgi:glycosyltransferase involved in cell wall biosynthesis
VTFVVPGTLDTPTGGFAYDRRIIEGLRRRGRPVEALRWEGAFPRPGPAAEARAAAELEKLPEGRIVVGDGLAWGGLPSLLRHQGTRLRLVALVHHPLALETGLTPEASRTLASLEREALAEVRAVVATSHHTARSLARDYGVTGVVVVPPGTDPPVPWVPPAGEGAGQRGGHVGHGTSARNDEPATLTLLAVGAVVPRKAHDVLIAALAEVARDTGPGPRLRLEVVGALDRDRGWADQVQAAAASGAGPGLEVVFRGAVDPTELAAAWARADVFVSASRHEGYGMAHAEALAHGLPIVATRAGAVAEVVPETAGHLVPVADPAALAAALREVVRQPERRAALAAGSRRAGVCLPGWEDAAAAFDAVLTGVADASPEPVP